jgi:pectate lyase
VVGTRMTWVAALGVAACNGGGADGSLSGGPGTAASFGDGMASSGTDDGGGGHDGPDPSDAGPGGGDSGGGDSGVDDSNADDSSVDDAGDSTDAAEGGPTSADASESAGESSGGASDSGGSAGCDSTEVVGWAAENGGTNGGAGGPTTMVDNADDLIALAAADGPQNIVVEGDITLPDRLEVTSDKTIEGAPGGATIHGSIVIYGAEDAPIENVILRNLFVDGADGAIDDAVSLQWAKNIWIDHCDVFDGIDGNLDITHGSDFVTVSWTRFHYTDAAPDPEHRFSSLIGHSDNNAAEDEGALRVTLHHDWWTDGVIERMPRVRFGQVHVFNSLFDSPDTNYAIRAAYEAEVLVEANYFDGIPNPHEIFVDGAEIVAIDNVYARTTGVQDEAGDAFDPPYAYAPDDAEEIVTMVPDCAGPR